MYVDGAYCYRQRTGSVVSWSVCLSVMIVRPGKTDEPWRCCVGYGLGWAKEACVRWGQHWHHLAIQLNSPCDGDAAFRQITLTTCHYYY